MPIVVFVPRNVIAEQWRTQGAATVPSEIPQKRKGRLTESLVQSFLPCSCLFVCLLFVRELPLEMKSCVPTVVELFVDFVQLSFLSFEKTPPEVQINH